MFDQKGTRKYLNGAERRAYFNAICKEPDELRRAFGLTLYYTGCRISEALGLAHGRIDAPSGLFVFETLKRRRKGVFRPVPVPDSLMALIDGAGQTVDAASLVWSFSRATGYRLIKHYMDEAAIQGSMASPKGLRHSFAVACLEKEIPITTVRKWMGHARLETTAIYLDVSGSEERNLAKRIWKE